MVYTNNLKVKHIFFDNINIDVINKRSFIYNHLNNILILFIMNNIYQAN